MITGNSFSYHDFEMAICGYSGAGKTTILENLLALFSKEYRVGVVKSDAHRFQMDHPGKDTQRFWASGAQTTHIFDSQHWSFLQRGEVDVFSAFQAFTSMDFVLIEGCKKSSLPKLVVVDKDEKIKAVELENVQGYIGSCSDKPDWIQGLPYFHRDDISGIASFILDYFVKKTSEVPLYGLLLSGGKSQRMEADKALLEIDGQKQMERSHALLSSVCSRVFYSHRRGQEGRELCSEEKTIFDRFHGFGPMAGILSAQIAHPKAAFLVLACDLPYLSVKALRHLMEQRKGMKMATAYKSVHNGLPEPLCAIYEPRSHRQLFQFMSVGRFCPRKVLMNSPTHLIDPLDTQALENMNYPQEYQVALQDLSSVDVGGQ